MQVMKSFTEMFAAKDLYMLIAMSYVYKEQGRLKEAEDLEKAMEEGRKS
jgi:hypothetical protein